MDSIGCPWTWNILFQISLTLPFIGLLIWRLYIYYREKVQNVWAHYMWLASCSRYTSRYRLYLNLFIPFCAATLLTFFLFSLFCCLLVSPNRPLKFVLASGLHYFKLGTLTFTVVSSWLELWTYQNVQALLTLKISNTEICPCHCTLYW